MVHTPRELFATVEQTLIDAGCKVDESELRWEPKNESELPVEKALKNIRLMEKLEELDDVQSVSSNLLLTTEIVAAFEAQ